MPKKITNNVLIYKAKKNFISKFLIGIELEGVHNSPITTQDLNLKWSAKHDASIRFGNKFKYGSEFVSPPIKVNKWGYLFEDVRELRKRGLRANKSCGFHIHVSSPVFKDLSNLENFIKVFYSHQELFFNIFKPLSSRVDFCQPLNELYVSNFITLLRSVKSWDALLIKLRRNLGDFNRYHWINLQALIKHGTIEFRLFNGSFNHSRILTTLQFLLTFFYWSMYNVSNAKKERVIKFSEALSIEMVEELTKVKLFKTFKGRIDNHLLFRIVRPLSESTLFKTHN